MVKKQSKTRRIKKGVMTIPQLRKAFDHIETFTSSLLQKTADAKQRRVAFQKEWKKTFHRSVDDKAADAYLNFEATKGKKGKTKKQRGGATLAGAPLDYSTRPGIEGVYGSFPAYVSSGLAFYNDINKQAPVAGCGVENTTPKVPISIGSNEVQKGGKRKTRKTKRQGGGGAFPSISEFAQALSFRPIASSIPPTTAYNVQMAYKGAPPPPPSQPNTATPPYIPFKPMTLAGVAVDINRDLGSEIRS